MSNKIMLCVASDYETTVEILGKCCELQSQISLHLEEIFSREENAFLERNQDMRSIIFTTTQETSKIFGEHFNRPLFQALGKRYLLDGSVVSNLTFVTEDIMKTFESADAIGLFEEAIRNFEIPYLEVDNSTGECVEKTSTLEDYIDNKAIEYIAHIVETEYRKTKDQIQSTIHDTLTRMAKLK